MAAKAIAAIVAGLGLLVLGGGGTIIVAGAWILGMLEVSMVYWLLPLAAVTGLAVATYGIVRIAGDVIENADGWRDVANDLNWRQFKHVID